MIGRRKAGRSLAEQLRRLVTESRSPYEDLDRLDTEAILRIINEEDQKAPLAVREVLGEVAEAVEMIAGRLAQGGRLFYAGAGTSGRLGVLDASECPPTFGAPPGMVQGVIAGGERALVGAVEEEEDRAESGEKDLEGRGCSGGDVVVAISASGRTPYCLGALRYARRVGAGRIALVCNPASPMEELAEVTICPVVGPEVLMGSTRMKAGTAQKLVLNMLSTAAMIRLGKVYSNLMVDLQPTNEKLRDRAVRIVELATGASRQEAARALDAAGLKPKAAIVMLLAGCSAEEASRLLGENQGFVRRALAAARAAR